MKDKLSTLCSAEFLLSPLAQGLVGVFIVMVGALASLWSPEILNASHFFWGDNVVFSIKATTFWFFMILLAVILSRASYLKARNLAYTISLLHRAPTSDFLDRFAKRYLITNKLLKEVQNVLDTISTAESEPNSEDLKDAVEFISGAIRSTLDSIVHLVKEFDRANGGKSIIYRANLMQIVYFNESSQPPKQFLDWLHFFSEKFTQSPQASDLYRDYSGFVYLFDNALTTTTETEDPDKDIAIRPIAFPFTLSVSDDTRTSLRGFGNLPGAPTVVETKNPHVILSPNAVFEHISKWNITSNDLVEGIKQYYANHKLARSILSVPLQLDQRVIGVLNVYRNKEDILFAGDKADDCFNVLAPFVASITDMLVCLEKVLVRTGRDFTLGDNSHVKRAS